MLRDVAILAQGKPQRNKLKDELYNLGQTPGALRERAREADPCLHYAW